jgi:hypothetical protein
LFLFFAAKGNFNFMADSKQQALEELLRSGSEAFLALKGADELKNISGQTSSGAFLLMYESEASLTATKANPSTSAPGKFQFLPSEGIAFLYEQMDLPPPPSITFDPLTQCIVVAVVCLATGEEGEGAIYQNMFVYTF